MSGLSRRTQPFSPDQLRMASDAVNHYEQWLEQKRMVAAHAGWMGWRTKNGTDYLTWDIKGIQKSLGSRSPTTEQFYQEFIESKDQAKADLKAIEERLAERAKMIKALRMGRILGPLAKVVREYDAQGMVGNHLMVAGTHAIDAYEAMAGRWFDSSLSATEDLDFVWRGASEKTDLLVKGGAPALLKHLKTVDSTFTINTEKTFQVRNAKGLVVDFITDAEGERSSPREALKPVAIAGQQWLLAAKPVSAVAFDLSGFPVRLVVPDPRVFACHKLWVSEKTDRDPLKRHKDLQQGLAVGLLTQNHLPMYPFDAEFLDALPAELLDVYKRHLQPALEQKAESTGDPEPGM